MHPPPEDPGPVPGAESFRQAYDAVGQRYDREPQGR